MAAHAGDVQPCISTTRYLQEIYSQIRHLRKNVNLCMTSCRPDTTYFIRGSTEAYADGEVLNI